MGLFINIFTAWVSVLLLFAVVVIWILRVLIKKKIIKKGSFLFGLNRTLRLYHKRIGIAFLVVSLIHGFFSSQKIISTDWGSITFFAIAIMSASYMIKSKMTRKLWVNIHRALTVAVVVLTVIHLLDVGITAHILIKNAFSPKQDVEQISQDDTDSDMFDLAEKPLKDESVVSDEETMDNSDEVSVENKMYVDGVYEGVADGFGSDLTVEVTIKDDLIEQVVIISHNEVGQQFYGYPMEYLPDEIVEKQTPQVDSISGATMTSTGIKNAVIDALNKAATSGDQFEQEELPQSRHGGRRH